MKKILLLTITSLSISCQTSEQRALKEHQIKANEFWNSSIKYQEISDSITNPFQP